MTPNMQSLSEFISVRFRELDAAERPLLEKLRAISDEREQLRRAATAAGIALSLEGDHQAPPLTSQRRTIPEKTIKEAVMDVLKAKGAGMTALEILAAINLQFSTDYPRTSLSPQLSRLKAEGKIVREGIVWQLPDGSGKEKSASTMEDALL